MINKDTYKRFTELKTYNNGKKMYVQYSVSGCYNDMNRKGDYTTGDSVDRLAELEDKIENGTLVESPCKVEDMIYNKNIKFYLNCKEIPFEELSKLPQMTVDRENHTITEVVLHYIDKDAIFFYTKTEHYTVADDVDEGYYGEM